MSLPRVGPAAPVALGARRFYRETRGSPRACPGRVPGPAPEPFRHGFRHGPRISASLLRDDSRFRESAAGC